MIDLVKLSRRPLKLCPTRVWRTYTGGKLIDEWRGSETLIDSNYPEEWVSLLVTAYDPSNPETREGMKKGALMSRRVISSLFATVSVGWWAKT